MSTEAAEVVTIGESMGLFFAPDGRVVESRPHFEVSFGGAESNVAIGLARLGRRVEWIGRLGDDELGHFIARELRGEHVTVADRFGGGPTGIMVRTRRGHGRAFVQYARTGSAGSTLAPADLDLEAIRNARLLHVSGITAALGEAPRAAVELAVRTARAAGVLVSFDVNHRQALWQRDDARTALAGLIAGSDIVFATDAEARLVLGVSDPTRTDEDLAHGLAAMGVSEVVVKRGSEGSLSLVGGSRYDQHLLPAAERDAVGAGDAFAAGYIDALLSGHDPQQRLDFAGTVAAHAVTVIGDWEGLPRAGDLAHHSQADILR
ncbi:sugar kinase [Leucobacter iarius]|uniref:Sugar kinase n=1 Tax=Leucobacter iarius TaxID=333963 RepID=A0ABP4XIT1_9MICO